MEEAKKLNEKYNELKAKYNELRERFLDLQKDEWEKRTNWQILFGRSLALERECNSLKNRNKALSEENERIKSELKHKEELIQKNIYTDFLRVLEVKKQQFEDEFPPIE